LLKEDFKYNLTLLEARDAELRRLEGVATTLYGDAETLKAEKAALLQRLDRAQVKENERKERMKAEAALHKVWISLPVYYFKFMHSIFCSKCSQMCKLN
jgi:hypothetical protein